MTLPRLDPVACLAGLAEINSAIREGNPDAAAVSYAEHSPYLSAKASVEWKLIEALARHRPQIPDLEWQAEVSQRPSGAALIFVCHQLAATEWPATAAFFDQTSAPKSARTALAEAWLWRPECFALRDSRFRRKWVLHLAQEADALGPCLLAAAEIGDRDLIETLAERWLARGLRAMSTPRLIERMSQMDLTRSSADAGLQRLLGFSYAGLDVHLALIRTAHTLGRFSTVLALAKTALDQPSLEGEALSSVEAHQLGALVELEKLNEAATIYRSRWMTREEPFPYPEWLVYAFHRFGDTSLLAHLLESTRSLPDLPTWIPLYRHLAEGRRIGRSALEAWQQLYEDRQQDERLLVGISEAVLASPLLLREEWLSRLGLIARWQHLLNFESHNELARAYLVLLQPTDEECIEAFETHFERATLHRAAVRRAARRYVRSQRRLRRWPELRRLSTAWPDLFDIACPFEERELARLLGSQIDLPQDAVQFRSWCAVWERLLSLPLEGDEVLEVLGHFLRLRQQLAGSFRIHNSAPLLTDISLQILRRSKVEVDRRLGINHDRATAQLLLQRIKGAGLEATFRILEDLDSQGAQSE